MADFRAFDTERDAGFLIASYDWSWHCPACDSRNESVNGGVDVTDGTELQCANCDATYRIGVERAD